MYRNDYPVEEDIVFTEEELDNAKALEHDDGQD